MKPKPQYQCVMPSVEAFVARVQRLVSRGYYFAYDGYLKPPKDPAKLDAKMIREWKLYRPDWTREARRRGGESGVHYIRYGRRYVLLATHGWRQSRGRGANQKSAGRFFTQHPGYRDLKDEGLKFYAYNIKSTYSHRLRRRTTFVSLRSSNYHALKAGMLRKAVRGEYRRREALEAVFWNLPLIWYGPVQRQVRAIVNDVNRTRHRSGLSRIRITRCVRRSRFANRRCKPDSCGGRSAATSGHRR